MVVVLHQFEFGDLNLIFGKMKEPLSKYVKLLIWNLAMSASVLISLLLGHKVPCSLMHACIQQGLVRLLLFSR